MFKNPYDPRFGPYFDTNGAPPLRPLPHTYPYVEPCVHDSYSHNIYHEYHGYPHPGEFPTSGSMAGSAFLLKEYYPYLFDNTNVRYGNFLNLAENVNTRISQRRDDSCVNLIATFDMTKGVLKNTILNDYLQKAIAKNVDTMQEVLSIVQDAVTFRLYFSIVDEMGAFVYQNAVSVTTPDMYFHPTDIRDYFVESLKSVFVTNIPAMDYTGIYRLQLEKIEAYVNIINTIDHMSDGMNPFYAFTDNNNKIVLQHDIIDNTEIDQQVLIASQEIKQVFPFQANITTRLRISFTAFLSDLIAVPQTYGIWSSIFEPTEAKLEKMQNSITTLTESVDLINASLLTITSTLNELRTTVSNHTTQLETNTTKIAQLDSEVEANYNDFDARIRSLDERVTTLESRPLALYRYGEGIKFTRSQLTYSSYGQIYQVAKDFTASGNMNEDIENGNIVPLTINGEIATINNTLSDLIDRVSALEETSGS